MRKGLGCLGIVFVGVIVLVVIFAALGGSESGSKPGKPEKQEYKIGEKVKVDDLEYTVNDIERADTVGNQYVSSNADGRYIVADVTVKNNGDETITIDTELFKILNGDATNGADAAASTNANPSDIGFFLKQLNPSNEKSGKVVFDVSEKAAQSNKLKMQVSSGMFGTEKAEISLK